MAQSCARVCRSWRFTETTAERCTNFRQYVHTWVALLHGTQLRKRGTVRVTDRSIALMAESITARPTATCHQNSSCLDCSAASYEVDNQHHHGHDQKQVDQAAT